MTDLRLGPARGTRPRNRRELIVEAASTLFATRGYDAISMGDVAQAVNVQPSALYRHFSSKQELLGEVVSRGTRLRHDAVLTAEHHGLRKMLEALAESGIQSRTSTRLWSVEVRHAEPALRAALLDEVRALPDVLAKSVREGQPELSAGESQVVAWAALDVLASISFHEERLPARELRDLLADAMERVIAVPVDGDEDDKPLVTSVEHPARRERLLSEATRLFASRGFGSVRLDEIASASGMSTASVYTYVDGKSALLELVVVRASEALAQTHVRALESAADPMDVLDALVDCYVLSAWTQPAQLAVLLTETGHLRPEVGASVRQTLDDIDSAWAAVIQRIDPKRRASVVRVQTRAARLIAQDVLGTPRLRAEPNVLSIVRAAMCAVLLVS